MQVRILQTAPYGRLATVNRNEGDVVPAQDFGDLDYVADCVASGHIEIVEDGEAAEMPESPAPAAAQIINGKGEVVLAAGVDATDTALAIAMAAGIDLSTVKGSGKNGRILAADVEAAAREG